MSQGQGQISSHDAGAWTVAWKATHVLGIKKKKGQPRPYSMCQGRQGQIIACNKHGEETSVTVFDITQVPFKVVVPELDLGMNAGDLCYCDLPGIGGALAVTDGMYGHKLCMFSLDCCAPGLDSGALLWTVGGAGVKVAGAEWDPRGVCTDNRGHLYVADWGNHCVIVLSAASGTVLQVLQRTGHWEGAAWVLDPGTTVYGPDIAYKENRPRNGVMSGTVVQEIKERQIGRPIHVCWHEEGKSIIVATAVGKISHFNITF